MLMSPVQGRNRPMFEDPSNCPCLLVPVLRIMSVLLHAVETGTMLNGHLAPLFVFHVTCLGRILVMLLRDHVKNDHILSRWKEPSSESEPRSKKLR